MRLVVPPQAVSPCFSVHNFIANENRGRLRMGQPHTARNYCFFEFPGVGMAVVDRYSVAVGRSWWIHWVLPAAQELRPTIVHSTWDFPGQVRFPQGQYFFTIGYTHIFHPDCCKAIYPWAKLTILHGNIMPISQNWLKKNLTPLGHQPEFFP